MKQEFVQKSYEDLLTWNSEKLEVLAKFFKVNTNLSKEKLAKKLARKIYSKFGSKKARMNGSDIPDLLRNDINGLIEIVNVTLQALSDAGISEDELYDMLVTAADVTKTIAKERVGFVPETVLDQIEDLPVEDVLEIITTQRMIGNMNGAEPYMRAGYEEDEWFGPDEDEDEDEEPFVPMQQQPLSSRIGSAVGSGARAVGRGVRAGAEYTRSFFSGQSLMVIFAWVFFALSLIWLAYANKEYQDAKREWLEKETSMYGFGGLISRATEATGITNRQTNIDRLYKQMKWAAFTSLLSTGPAFGLNQRVVDILREHPGLRTFLGWIAGIPLAIGAPQAVNYFLSNNAEQKIFNWISGVPSVLTPEAGAFIFMILYIYNASDAPDSWHAQNPALASITNLFAALEKTGRFIQSLSQPPRSRQLEGRAQVQEEEEEEEEEAPARAPARGRGGRRRR